MVEDQPPGFRFYPTEEELVSFYLHNKLIGGQSQRQDHLNRLMDRIIPVLNIYDYNPWELPQFSQHLCYRDQEQWFFLIARQESEARGGRPNRLTTDGYWKATGSPGFVYSSNNNRPVGEKRTMVFYQGRAPNGRKTEWKMNEYKAIDQASTSAATPLMVRQEFSLCRLYNKSKCLRAFDRRPPPGVIINEPRVPQFPHHEAITTSFGHQDSSQMAAAHRTSSPETSSSGDHCGRQPQIGESSNGTTAAMTSNKELWWDGEQLDNWFYN